MIELLGQEPSKRAALNQHQHPSIVKATGQRVAALSRVAGAPRPIPRSCNNTLQAVVLPVHHPRLHKIAMVQPVPSTVRGIGPTVAVLLRVAVALRRIHLACEYIHPTVVKNARARRHIRIAILEIVPHQTWTVKVPTLGDLAQHLALLRLEYSTVPGPHQLLLVDMVLPARPQRRLRTASITVLWIAEGLGHTASVLTVGMATLGGFIFP